MDIVVPYEPNAKQRLFHACPAQEVVYGGAKGGGKSCALVMEALAYGLEYPGAEIYLFRETYDQLEANLIREWKSRVPREIYSYSETKHMARLGNGSTVYFRYVSSLEDAEGYNGRSIDFIGIDELTYHAEETVQILLSCCRSPRGFPPRFRGTCNPGQIGHEWVKRRYVVGTNYGANVVTDPLTGNQIAFIPATVYDNTVLMRNDPAYVRRLENLPPAKRAAYLEGNWDVFEGQYFSEWSHSRHVIRPFEIPSSWRRYISIDWGFAAPCAVLWHAVDPSNGRVYTYRELYVTQLRAAEVAMRAAQLSDGEAITTCYSSPDMWQERGLGKNAVEGETIAATFRHVWDRLGLYIPLEPADNRRVQGWNRVREYLSDAPDGLPWWQCFETCSNLIRTLPALVYDTRNVEDVSPRCEDHAPEALRYMLISRPSPVEAEVFLAGRANYQHKHWGFDAERDRFGVDIDDYDDSIDQGKTFYTV